MFSHSHAREPDLDDDDHDHDHDHHDFEHLLPYLRIGVAALIVLAPSRLPASSWFRPDRPGVITRFGNPVRVVTQPGLAWKLPAPIESVIPIDLRLRTSSTGLQDVGTRDGLRVLVQCLRRLAGTE